MKLLEALALAESGACIRRASFARHPALACAFVTVRPVSVEGVRWYLVELWRPVAGRYAEQHGFTITKEMKRAQDWEVFYASPTQFHHSADAI